MAVVLVFSRCEVQATVYHSTWVGGSQGEWGNAGNWNPAIVPDNTPTQTFAVTISTAERTRVVFNQDRTIDQLDCYGNVDLEIGVNHLYLVQPNGLTNHGKLGISGTGVEHEISGNVTNTSGGHIQLSNEIEFHGAFTNNGEVFVVPGAQFYIKSGSFINSGKFLIYSGFVMTDDVFENTKEGIVEGWGMVHGSQSLSNEGTIYASGGSLVLHSDSCLINTGILGNKSLSTLHVQLLADVNNVGTIESNLGGGVVFDCNLVNEPNGIIKLLGGTLAATTITQTADANFTGFGSITGDVFIDPNALIELTGPTNIVGDVNIAANATLEISDGTTLITGHTTCNNGTIHMIGGRVICQGGLTNNNCNIIWEPGTYTNMADFNLDGTVNFKDFAYFGNTWLWQADWY